MTDQHDLCEHLAVCPQCQALLGQLSDDAELRRQAPACWPSEGPAANEPALTHLLQALHDTPRPDAFRSADTAEGLDASLGFLRPPVHEGDLGTLGPYRVLKELGRGGMGIVLLAYDPDLRRTVALKVLPPAQADARARARFVREAQAAAGIEHDHVVPVHAVANPADGPPYLVMQYVEGPTLRQRIKAEGRLDPREAARIGAQVAEGLAAAHRTGLVHRDIKPANIILESPSSQPLSPAAGERGWGEGGQDHGLRPGPDDSSPRRNHPGGNRSGYAGIHEPGAGARAGPHRCAE